MLELDKTTFEAEVLQAPGKILVDFYGDGCVPCAALMPHVHGFADVYGDKDQVLRPEHPPRPAALPSLRRYSACPSSRSMRMAK